MTRYNYQLPLNFCATRLDKAILSLIPNNISRSCIQKVIKDAYVKVNSIIIYNSSYKVKENDIIEIILTKSKTIKMQKANITLDIIFEDEDLIVINKPAGLTVHPSDAGNHQDTLANALLYYSSKLSDIGGYFRPGIVHRLDKDTSGLMIVAKNNKAHIKIAKQIESRELIRQYKALIWGMMIPPTGIIQNNIGKDKSSRQKMTVLNVGGKNAITYYQTEKIYLNGLISLVDCKLKTGRTHQIRLHLSHMGHSIVGDQVYGHNSRKISIIPLSIQLSLKNLKRQALHSYYLGFIHPTINKFIEFSVALPLDISDIINVIKIQEV